MVGNKSLRSNLLMVVFLLAVTAFFAGSLQAAHFENSNYSIDIGTDGLWTSVLRKFPDTSTRELYYPSSNYFAKVVTAGGSYNCSSVTQNGNQLVVAFASGTTVTYDVTLYTNWITFEIASIAGTRPTSMTVCQVPIDITEHIGAMLSIAWDDETSVCLMASNFQVNCAASGTSYAKLYSTSQDSPGPALEGARVSLVICDTSGAADVLKDLSHTFGLLINEDANGVPSKDAIGRESYWFLGGVKETDAARIIEYCQRTNINQLMMSFSSWAKSAGHIEYNLTNFPQGADSLRNFAATLNAADINVGSHTFVSKVAKKDSYVTPVPDHRFWVDHETTLAGAINTTATSILVTSSLAEWPGSPLNIDNTWEGGVTKHMEVIIGDEIIRYTGIEKSPGSGDYDTFVGCMRGSWGTYVASHNSGALAKHWGVDGCINGYIIDQETTLIDEVTQRMADVFNECNFNMIYFDGGEDVPKDRYNYYASLCQKKTVEKINARPLKHLGTAKTHRLWHSISCGNTRDTYLNTNFGGVISSGGEPNWNFTVKDHIDRTYDGVIRAEESLFPGEFGWFGIWSERSYTDSNGIIHTLDGLQIDETEYLMCKCLGLNAPLSLETSFSQMDAHALTGQILDIVGVFEAMRANRDSMDPNLLELLKSKGDDYSYIQTPDGNEFISVDEIKPMRGGTDIRCWMGELADGSVVATLWHYKGYSLTLGLPVSDLIAAESVTALDWWGEEVVLSVVNGEIQIPVGNRRLTLIFDGVAGDIVKNYLSTGHKRVVDPHQPVKLSKNAVTVTASSEYPLAGRPAINLINESGLDEECLLHDDNKVNMWSTEVNYGGGYEDPYGPTVSGPVWIAFDFDRVFNLEDIWIWNYNRMNEGDYTGYGIRDAVVQYTDVDSNDPADWYTLGTFEFAKAPGLDDYEHDIEIKLGGVAVKHVVITGLTSWTASAGNFGLSEVRFNLAHMYAADPVPADDANNLDTDVELNWRPGRYAANTHLYAGTDFNSIRDADFGSADFVIDTESNSLGLENLEFDTKYYWVADSIGDPLGLGYIWSFTTRAPRQLAAAAMTQPTGWWKFDDNTNSGTAGATGDLTFYFDTHIEADAERGNVVSLDGTFRYDFANHGMRLGKQTGTISHWLKPGDTGNRAAYYEAGGTTSGYNGFGGTDIYEVHTGIFNGQWYVCYQDGTYASVSGVTVEPGVWTHVAVTWDRAGELVLYINGEIADSMDISGISFSDMPAVVSQFGRVGNGTSTYYWKGEIDDAKVYNAALTADEIGIVMNGGSSGGLGAALNPTPEHNSQLTNGSTTLTWESGMWASEHDVYIGTDFNSVAGANHNYAEYLGRFADANIELEGLEAGTNYYWVVDEIDGLDKWLGDVWKFSTPNSINFSQSDTASNSFSWSHMTGNSDKQIMVVTIAAEDDSAADVVISSVTFGGVAMHPVAGSYVTVGTDPVNMTTVYYLLADEFPAEQVGTVEVVFAGQVNSCIGGSMPLFDRAQVAPAGLTTAMINGSRGISTIIEPEDDGMIAVSSLSCGNAGLFSDIYGYGEEISGNSTTQFSSSTNSLTMTGETGIAWRFDHDNDAQLTMSTATFAPCIAYGYTELAELSDNWLSDGSSGGDFDGNGTVDFEDFAKLAAGWVN